MWCGAYFCSCHKTLILKNSTQPTLEKVCFPRTDTQADTLAFDAFFCKTARYPVATRHFIYFLYIQRAFYVAVALRGHINASSKHPQPRNRLRSHIQLPQKEKLYKQQRTNESDANEHFFSYSCRFGVEIGTMRVVPLIVVFFFVIVCMGLLQTKRCAENKRWKLYQMRGK